MAPPTARRTTMDFCGTRTHFFAPWVLLHSGFSIDGKSPGRLLLIFDLGSRGTSFLCCQKPLKLRGRAFRAKHRVIGSVGYLKRWIFHLQNFSTRSVSHRLGRWT